MVKRIPGKNGQKRLIKLHLLHLTIEFPIFPIFKSKCIFKGLESEAKKGFSTFEVKMSLEKRVFILAAFVKRWDDISSDDNSSTLTKAVYDCFTRLLRA